MHGEDTIVAVATGAGRSAIAVIRVSGPKTRRILEAVTGSTPKPRMASLRAIRASDGTVLDQALVLYFVSPASFTGEDVAEFHLHGGQAVVSAVLRCLIGTGLCRLAEPGEFSRRAFLNGKLDLAEAEGIADLIDAETESQRRQAMRQLEGALSQTVESWRARLIDAMALTEASLDFSDEGDVPEGLIEESIAIVTGVQAEIASALDDNRTGERLRDGFTVVIVGAPNVGKSTLLNRIAGRDVAIVSSIAGTTRDLIELRCDLDGMPVVFVDTAGLRETDDPIEREGVERARKRATAADLVLYLIDNDIESSFELIDLADKFGSADILVVRSKLDLHPDYSSAIELAVSAKTGEGIDRLLKSITDRISSSCGSQAALVTRERHRLAFEDAKAHLLRVVGARLDLPPELLAEDIRLAARALGRVTGRVDVEEVLDRLFSGFCIGK